MNKEKWIIDTDPGCDDMFCILYMLNRKDIDVLMISLTEGNSTITNVCLNGKKIIKIANRLDVPIYKGGMPILNGCSTAVRSHCSDGLGDVPELINLTTEDVQLGEGRSSVKIVELINSYPNEINLLMIGPLTNLAIAYMLDPSIANKIKRIFILGGAIKSRGNKLPTGEFNFSYDCIAPKIVLDNFPRIIMIPWESFESFKIDLPTFQQVKKELEKEEVNYNKQTFYYSEKLFTKFHEIKGGMIICDLYCAMCIFKPQIVKKCFIGQCLFHCDSELFKGAVGIAKKKYAKSYDEGMKQIIEEQKPKKQLIVESLDLQEILSDLKTIFI